MKKMVSSLLIVAITFTITLSNIGRGAANSYVYTIKDAVKILEYLAELIELNDVQRQLYNLDPSTPDVGINDAVQILCYLAKLPSVLGGNFTGPCVRCKANSPVCPGCGWCTDCENLFEKYEHCSGCGWGRDCLLYSRKVDWCDSCVRCKTCCQC